MTKIPFSQYKPLSNGNRSIDEAISEVQREMDVRRRLFDKWVGDGRMSWVDAHDRLERLMTALRKLIAYAHMRDAELARHDNPPVVDDVAAPVIELDDERTEVPA